MNQPKTKYSITTEEVRECLDYNPDTGVFKWKSRDASTKGGRIFNAKFAGKEAGGRVKGRDVGYLRIRIKGIMIKAHRLAFICMGEDWPDSDVDHIDGNINNNRWNNLRRVDRKGNGRNQKLYRTNKSGVPGVYWNKSKSKYDVQIGSGKYREYIGCSKDFNDAVKMRKKKEMEIGYHENHGRV